MDRQINPQRTAVKKRKRRIKWDRIIIALCVLALIVFLLIKGVVLLIGLITGDSGKNSDDPVGKITYDMPADYIPASAKEDDLSEPEPEGPVDTFQETNRTAAFGSSIESDYGILVDLQNGTVLAQKQAYTTIYPASLVKIMTLLVAVENCEDISASFTMTNHIIDPLYIANASLAGFRAGEVITMEDLFYGTILPSGAEAATALAIATAGSEEAFVELMNEKAVELNLKGTHFTNVTGLHNNDQYSTVYDLAVILNAALENETCRKVLSAEEYTTSKTEQNPNGLALKSTLFSYMAGDEPEGATVMGGKTGYTTQAGHCLASYAEKNGGYYIMVVAHGATKWKPVFDSINSYSTLLSIILGE